MHVNKKYAKCLKILIKNILQKENVLDCFCPFLQWLHQKLQPTYMKIISFIEEKKTTKCDTNQ